MLNNPVNLYQIPTIDITDVELTAIKLALVVPEESINYFPNPSVEVNTTGYYSKVAPARDSTVAAAFGRNALKITPLDTNYSQVMAIALPDNNSDTRLSASSPATISFDLAGKPGEYVTATVEYPSIVDFFNRTTAAINGNTDDRNFYTYTATSGFTIQNSRLEATTLTDKNRAYILGNLGTGLRYLDGVFEADMRGIFTSAVVGAWPVLILAHNPSGGGPALGVRLEQGLVRILTMSVAGAETSLTTGAFTFVTGTQYNVRVAGVKQSNGDHIVNVYINNTLVISNYTVTAAVTNVIGGSYSGVWLSVVGAPAGANPYWDNLYFRDNNKLATKTFKLTSEYQRVSISYQYDRPNPPPILFIEKVAPYTMNPFWIDAFQYEMKAYATTYFDGDFDGTWDGLPHRSSSTRAPGQDGGKLIGFNDLFVKVTAVQGLGMPPLNNQSIALASSGGEIYQKTLSMKSIKTLVCVVNGDGAQDLARKMCAVENCFTPDALTGAGKNTKLYYQFVDPVTGGARGQLLQSSVKYRAGLEGSQNNDYQQKFVLQLEAFQTPDITEVYPEFVTLAASTGGGTFNGENVRSRGTWSFFAAPGIGLTVQTVYIDRRGAFWYGYGSGGIINQRNTTDTSYPAVTVSGGGVKTYAFLNMPNGYMYIGGDFTSPGNYFIRSTGGGSAFAQAGGATWNGAVNVLAALTDGRILIGGNFTLPFPFLAVYDPATNVASAIVPGLNAQVRDIVVLPDGSGFYFTGGFTTSTAVVVLTRIAFYNLKTSTVSALGTTAGNGLNNTGRALALGQNNKLYVGGDYTAANGVSISNIGAWNGYNFESVGASSAGLDAAVYDLAYNPADNMLYAAGNFLKTGTRSLTPGLAKYNGAIWLPVDYAMLPGTGINITSIAVNSNYLLFGAAAYGTTTAYPCAATTFTYSGTAGASPKIVLDNSTGTVAVQLFQLTNFTTGKTLYIDYTVAIGELLTIDITATGVKVTSNYGGDRPNALLPGSDISSFGFQPGSNILTFTAADSAGSNFSAYILYRNTHWSFNGGVY
jgi:hypothetical protein